MRMVPVYAGRGTSPIGSCAAPPPLKVGHAAASLRGRVHIMFAKFSGPLPLVHSIISTQPPLLMSEFG